MQKIVFERYFKHLWFYFQVHCEFIRRLKFSVLTLNKHLINRHPFNDDIRFKAIRKKKLFQLENL